MLSQYGVQPLGNLFQCDEVEGLRRRSQGLGQLSCMKDEVVLEMLWFLDAKDLCRLVSVSKALYVWCHYEDLWKALLMNHLQDTGKWLDFQGSWKESYQRQAVPNTEVVEMRPIQVSGMYSDLLFYRWWYANHPLERAWVSVDNIERVHRPTVEEFRERFELPNIPVLITGVVTEWPAFTKWDPDYFMSLGGNAVPFYGGGLSFSLPTYFSYAETNKDDLPVYLFDKASFDKLPALAEDYTVPAFFSEDFFSVLGLSRPDYRWLIVGPANSGSSFHKDPNCTSAWNAIVRGKKKWIFFPPNVTPPGVHPCHDGLDLATPITLVEWFTSFYKEAVKAKVKPIQCIAEAGDLVFVPNGWWHLVVNLESSIAITQNYVSRVNLPRVLDLLMNNKHLISGCPEEDRPTLYDRFVAAMEAKHPDRLAEARRQQAEEKTSHREKRKVLTFERCALPFRKAKLGGDDQQHWEAKGETGEVVAADKVESSACSQAGGGFCFGFFQ